MCTMETVSYIKRIWTAIMGMRGSSWEWNANSGNFRCMLKDEVHPRIVRFKWEGEFHLRKVKWNLGRRGSSNDSEVHLGR